VALPEISSATVHRIRAGASDALPRTGETGRPMTERWNRITELFARALAVGPAGRSRFLHEACGGDAAVEAEVDALLRADDQCPGDRFLKRRISHAVHQLLDSPPPAQGLPVFPAPPGPSDPP
jgi:hypothetical protein